MEIYSAWLASACFVEMESDTKRSEDNTRIAAILSNKLAYFLNLSLHKGYQQGGFIAAKLKDKIEKIRAI